MSPKKDVCELLICEDAENYSRQQESHQRKKTFFVALFAITAIALIVYPSNEAALVTQNQTVMTQAQDLTSLKQNTVNTEFSNIVSESIMLASSTEPLSLLEETEEEDGDWFDWFEEEEEALEEEIIEEANQIEEEIEEEIEVVEEEEQIIQEDEQTQGEEQGSQEEAVAQEEPSASSEEQTTAPNSEESSSSSTNNETTEENSSAQEQQPAEEQTAAPPASSPSEESSSATEPAALLSSENVEQFSDQNLQVLVDTLKQKMQGNDELTSTVFKLLSEKPAQ